MKLMIASDLHGSDYWCARMLEAFETEQPERLMFLGDILYHGPRNDLPREYAPKQVIAKLTPLKDRILCVRGNCDCEVDQRVLPFPVLADYGFLLLGDILYHGPRNDLPRDYAPKKVIAMLNGMADTILCVRGNCDTEVDQLVLAFPILAD